MDAGIIHVDYCTEDGTAQASDVYLPVSGTLTFDAKETIKQIAIKIIDDEEYDRDKEFCIRLSNAAADLQDVKVVIESPTGLVRILDNDHAGIFEFDSDKLEIAETVITAEIKV